MKKITNKRMLADGKQENLPIIDKESPIPLYYQLERFFEHKIISGELNPGDQFPTESELCSYFGLSRSVVRQAIKNLVDEDLVWRTPGKGTFISSIKRSHHTLRKLRGFFRDVTDEGLTTKSKVLEIGFIQICGRISNLLQVTEGSTVLFLNRLRYINNEPVVISRTYIPINIISPQLANEDFENNSFYEIIENKYGYKITHSHRIIEAAVATQEEAKLLDIHSGDGLILIRTTSFLKDKTPFEYDIGLHRGDKIRFEIDVVEEHNENYNLDIPERTKNDSG